jgi:AcrR family transcriptional regulator
MARPPTRETQGERRARTRAALVEAAARLFARHGVDAVSVDAVSDAAGRTSGAVYDHFGSKQGLLMAVLDDWTDALVGAVVTEMEQAPDLHGRLRAVAANVIVHPSESTRRLLMLEHELALRAARDPRVAQAMRERTGRARRRLAGGLARWVAQGVLPPGSARPEELAATIRAVVLGMEMQQRLDPGAFDVDRAASVLEAVLRPSPTADGPWRPRTSPEEHNGPRRTGGIRAHRDL